MQTLLDTGVCDVRRQNRAGYTPVMLASLLIIDADVHRDIIRRLFIVGDVNIKSATVCDLSKLKPLYYLLVYYLKAGLKNSVQSCHFFVLA